MDGLVISQPINRDLHTHQDSHCGIYNHAKYIIYRILTLDPCDYMGVVRSSQCVCVCLSLCEVLLGGFNDQLYHAWFET